ncbi:MAG: translation elongation factor Ts [Deltaproteobacteria bacterium]|nr:translation elongation factor Ts [Deltaproteobacteria bacterium]
MAEITAQMVKELRDQTGAGMMDCKAALADSNGDADKAIEFLRKKGLKNVTKRAGKVASEGIVYSYIHAGSKIGVMLELNSETDFVAKGEDFTGLARAIAMHIAWANPKYLSREDVPNQVIEKEKEIALSQLNPQQQKMADKILPGKLEKFYGDVCLLEQLEAINPEAKKTIKDLINDLSAKVGEKIVLKRFLRFEVGEGIEKQTTDFAAEVQAAIK